MTYQEAINRPLLTPAQTLALIHTRRIKENNEYVVTIDGEVYVQERNTPNPKKELVESYEKAGVLHVKIPVTDKNDVTTILEFNLNDLVTEYFPQSVTHVTTRNVTPPKKSVTPNIKLSKNDVTGGVTSSSVTPSKKSEAATGASNSKVLGYYVICGTRYESARASAKALDTNVNNILRKVTAKHPDYLFFPFD